MKNETSKFTNLIECSSYFSDENKCLEHLKQQRWKDGIFCPHCGTTKVYAFTDNKRYKCSSCRKQFTAKVGTIFEGTKVPLQKWYAAIYLITSHKKGISSLQLHRDLGVTQKTAWYMLHRVRVSLGLEISPVKLTGTIEADETFIGGKEGNKHQHKRTEGTQGRNIQKKSAVAGVVQRGGKVKAKQVTDTS